MSAPLPRPRAGIATVTVAAFALLAAIGPVAVAADHASVHFGEPTATATYGRGIEFVQPVEIGEPIERLELLVGRPGDSGPFVIEVSPPGALGSVTLRQLLDTESSGHLLPNTTLSARWVATLGGAGREVVRGPEVRVTYRDTEHDWRTREGEIVRVHWYEGGDAFGERALAIGEEAVQETADLLGVTETEPIDFFVYASEADLRAVLGPGVRENVGGQANAEIRTLFGLISPSEINDPWVETVIPHELVHLVFDTTVRNPYHFPPRWLNEGLAVYLSEGYESSDRRLVERAARDRAIIPLDGLTGQFPTTRDGFFLAYAESVAAVDFLVRTHGRDALVALVRSYADGVTDDEAFERAIGQSVAEFDAAWRADLAAGEPTVHGPQPAPAGPLPPGWEPAPGGPVATPAGEPAEAPIPGAAPDELPGVAILVVLGLGLFAAGATLLIRSRRAAQPAAPAGAWSHPPIAPNVPPPPPPYGRPREPDDPPVGWS